jgi:hypothetical protein
MAKPVDDRSPPVNDAYGDYNVRSSDGNYYFEWTPFTPAIRAWESAQRYLRSARDRLVDAGKIEGFAIPGLDADYREFAEKLEVITRDVDAATREARTVVQVLDAANTDYANANDASYEEYERLRDVIDNTLAAQGRPRR